MSRSVGRIAWIDTLKGMGIIFVVLGHGYSSANPKTLAYIYSFHMPLFFFLAGYVLKGDSTAAFGPFFLRRLRTRIVPYIFFFLIYYAAGLIMFTQQTGLKISSVMLMDGHEKLAAMVLADRDVLDGMGNVALWFLPCLFLAENIVFLVRRVAGKNRAALLAGVAVLSFIAYGESVTGYLGLHGTAVTAMTAAVFYGCGSVAGETSVNEGIFQGLRGNGVSAWLAAIAASVALSFLNGRVDMSANYYGNYLLFYGAAFSGILCYALTARFISPSPWLAYFGKNSLIILCLHLSLAQAARALYKTVFKRLFGTEYAIVHNDFYVVLIAALTLAFSIPCIYGIQTFRSAVIGKQKQQLAETP